MCKLLQACRIQLRVTGICSSRLLKNSSQLTEEDASLIACNLGVGDAWIG
jgi:hypothetical protein